MRLLLDTHILLWWLADDRKLTKRARALIANPSNEILVSSVSLWEVAINAALDRIEIELEELEEGVLRSGFRPLLIGFAHAIGTGRLPVTHRDPFDRMLIAQAGIEELRILSNDRIFDKYPLPNQSLPPIIV